MKMKIQIGRKGAAGGKSYKFLEHDEAEIGLLTGTEIEEIRPYSSKKPVTCFSSPLLDPRRNGLQQKTENDDVSSTISSLLKKKDSDYAKMRNDECVGTLETDCSVSLLSNPTLTEAQKAGQLKTNGGNDIVRCCVQSVVKVKEKFEDDVSLNPLPASKIRTMLRKPSATLIDEPGVIENIAFSYFRDPGSLTSPSPYSQKMRSFLFDDTQQYIYDELRDDSSTGMRRSKEDREQPPIDALMIREEKDLSPQHSNKLSMVLSRKPNSSTPSFEEIIDLMGVASSSSTSSLQLDHKPEKNNDEQESSISFSFEENMPDEQNYQDMSPEEKAKIAANIAELNRQFYARRENLSNLEREKMRRQKIKWWDDERSVISRVASSVYGEASRCQSSNSPQRVASCNTHESSFNILQNLFCFLDVMKSGPNSERRNADNREVGDIAVVVDDSDNEIVEDKDDDDDDEDHEEEDDNYSNYSIDIAELNEDDDEEDDDDDDGTVDFHIAELNEDDDEEDDDDDDGTVDLSNGIDGVDYLSSSTSDG